MKENMIEKIKKWVEEIRELHLYFNCYTVMEEKGAANAEICHGIHGTDIHSDCTNTLHEWCKSCPYYSHIEECHLNII